MTNTQPEKKGKNWLWALLAAIVLIGLVVFLMSRTGRADLDGPAEEGAAASTGTGVTAGGLAEGGGTAGTTAPADAAAGAATAPVAVPTGPNPGTSVDNDGDGVPAGSE